MKTVLLDKERRWEGSESRLFNVILCWDCGAISYQRRAKRTQESVKSTCRSCQDNGKQGQLTPAQTLELNAHYRQDDRTFHPLYSTYRGMRERCFNPNHPWYPEYGGRGIDICTRWLVDFWAFVEDMGPKPHPYMQIDRIDNDGNYEPTNCRWVTPIENVNNRRCSPDNRDPLLAEIIKDQQRILKNAQQRIRRKAAYVPAEKNWWHHLGLSANPYVYGPMPWKKTSLAARKEEAVERGWHTPRKNKKK